MSHDTRVASIAAAVRETAQATGGVHIDKGGVHHVVPLPGDARFSSRSIDASSLTNILEIDTENKICVAEPGVTFEQLVRATLPLGLAPTVVPELRGITVGGAVAGCSVESMSFRLGGFHDSCLEYEVIGGDGTVHVVNETNSPDLFHHLHGSYGTFGVLTKVAFRLVDAAPYVDVTYIHATSIADFKEFLTIYSDPTATGHDFVDGIVHGPKHMTVVVGRFTHDLGARNLSVYSGEEIYYRVASKRNNDIMTTEEYFFRYDRECHWMTATIPGLQNKYVRRALGSKVLGSTNLISLSNTFAPMMQKVLRRPDLVCDIFIPERSFDEFWEWYTTVFDFWPLWVVPYRPQSLYPWIGPHVREGFAEGDLFIDFAVYGKRNIERNRDYSVLLEEKTFELGGIKTLIGRNHYSRERFWEVYDQPAYDNAKAQLDPAGLFPNLYDKLGRVD